jgi:four helix bundle protein
MATIESFEELKCWQEARVYCQNIYTALLSNIDIKDYPLKDQINRASGSVMDNIAEGFGRGGNKEFKQFLSIAKASCAETNSQLYRASDRTYITKEQFENLSNESVVIQKMISGLIKYLNNSAYKGSKFMEDATPYGITS